MNKVGHIFRVIFRFLAVWFVDTLSLLITAWIISGISFVPVAGVPVIVVATAAALLLGIVNLLIRPLILMLAMPLGWIFIFLIGFFINAIVLIITSALLPGFQVDGLWAAFIGGIFLFPFSR
jgi:putative membrane protein